MDNYHKLVRDKKNLLQAFKLYRTDDYLLLIDTVWASENYKRIYFKDIEGVHVHHTNGYLFVLFLHLALMALFAMISSALFFSPSMFKFIFFSLIGIIPFIMTAFAFVRNLVKGKMCKVYVYSAVQRLHLRNVDRVDMVDKFLEDISPFIEKTQGESVDVKAMLDNEKSDANSSHVNEAENSSLANEAGFEVKTEMSPVDRPVDKGFNPPGSTEEEKDKWN